MKKDISSRMAALRLALLIAAGFFIGPAARADAVQVVLDDLTFGDSTLPYGPEVFTGSFFYDPVADVISSIMVTGGGASDFIVGEPLPFGGFSSSGDEPKEFLISDGFGDLLDLFLSGGAAPDTYGPGDAVLIADGALSLGGFTPYPGESASSGSFSVVPSAVPEPSFVTALLIGLFGLVLVKVYRNGLRFRPRVK